MTLDNKQVNELTTSASEDLSEQSGEWQDLEDEKMPDDYKLGQERKGPSTHQQWKEKT